MSTPPAGSGRTSLSGISLRSASSALSSLRYVPTNPPYKAAAMLSGCRSRWSVRYDELDKQMNHTDHKTVVQHSSL